MSKSAARRTGVAAHVCAISHNQHGVHVPVRAPHGWIRCRTRASLLSTRPTALISRMIDLAMKYPGLVVNGVYTGKLDDAGETLRLATPSGTTVLELTYNNTPPWPVTADGLGWSLVLDDPVAVTYRPSTVAGGSPGRKANSPSQM